MPSQTAAGKVQQDGGPPQAGPLMAVGNPALVRDLCAAVADLGAPASAAERGWTGLRLAELMDVQADAGNEAQHTGGELVVS